MTQLIHTGGHLSLVPAVDVPDPHVGHLDLGVLKDLPDHHNQAEVMTSVTHLVENYLDYF